ncbi:MAG: MBL fold metallo-hydrolase [Burkholderiaceae bacterium]|nr:MBL fold metallo-hydrolase [Burkholderiaceae bacterium]
MDGQTDAAESSQTVSYPFEAPPARGQTLEVVSGVHWIRMPLPYALDHINLWAIEDGDAWTIVDTGTCTENNAQVWREVFANSGDKRPISRILVTHMHPDHVGMAGWLGRKFNARLWMTRLEYLSCRVMVSDTGREAPPEGVAFYQQAGWGDAALETYRLRFGNFGKHIHALPESFRRIADQEIIRIGGHDWRVIVGRGHSPEHACLYCESLGVLISGDQVLPRISSNVSVYPTEPDANPMQEWLDSLARIQREVPDDVLVLPSHNEPFRGLHARLDRLAGGQVKALRRLKNALAEPKRAVDVFGALFARTITEQDVALLSMATGEALACLNYWMALGEVKRECVNGVNWYSNRA